VHCCCLKGQVLWSILDRRCGGGRSYFSKGNEKKSIEIIVERKEREKEK